MPKTFAMFLISIIFLSCTHTAVYAEKLNFAVGPADGAFMPYANSIKALLQKERITVNIASTNGSQENIKLVNSGQADIGIAYSGDIFFAINSKKQGDAKGYEDIMLVSCLYGSPAQMVVRTDSGINSAFDLQWKKIGIGERGSSTAELAERFFNNYGLWNRVRPWFIGYDNASTLFKNKQIDAFLVFSSFPNESITNTANSADMKLLNLWDDAVKNGFITKYPFYTKVVIPAGTYKNQTEAVATFQDNVVLIANKNMDTDLIYNAVKTIYSPTGILKMKSIYPIDEENFGNPEFCNVVTLHPGSEKYWKSNNRFK